MKEARENAPIVLGLMIWAVILFTLAMAGCHSATPPEPVLMSSLDEAPEPCWEANDAFWAAMETAGGCPGYLWRDEWCTNIGRECDAGTDLMMHLWNSSTIRTGSDFRQTPSCRTLYWSRGAYCEMGNHAQ